MKVDGRILLLESPDYVRDRNTRLALWGLVALLIATLGFMMARDAGTRLSPTTGESTKIELPATPPPPVEPVKLIEVSPADARMINEAKPFASGSNPAARPFLLRGSGVDRESAVTCLAAAGWYEAGDDRPGQQAVMQVVLNRMRHPAFPKSVCGVVFQGSERATGCQFTFTCDGALVRQPSVDAWKRARTAAEAAVSGRVEPKVGLATHYHTDWVVPYWSPTLDKIAKVGTHLFFRWPGGWGRPPAFRQAYAGHERIDPRIVRFADPAVRSALDVAEAPPTLVATVDNTVSDALPPPVELKGITKADLKGATVRLADQEKGFYVLQLVRGGFAGSYAVTAVTICRGKPLCAVYGYLFPERIPHALPVPTEQIRRASFFYRRNRDAGTEAVFWNCQHVEGIDPTKCFPGTGREEPVAATDAPVTG